MNAAKVRNQLLNVVTVVLAGCAVVVTAIRVHEFVKPAGAEGRKPDRKVPNWRQFGTAGHRMGSQSAPVSIVEFADFQCPYCRFAVTSLKELRNWYRTDVAVVYRHLLLPGHAFARPAALAAECAAREGRFEALHDSLYAQADSIGVKRWSRFALEAGIPDTTRFLQCMEDPAIAGAMTRDSIAAAQLGLTATPSFLINDRLVVGNPGFEALNEHVVAAIKESRRHARSQAPAQSGR